LATAEVFDPNTGSWTLTRPMHVARYGHIAVTLSDGKIMVTGGTIAPLVATASAEVYDPATGTWHQVASMSTTRTGHLAIFLTKGSGAGKVLVADGAPVENDRGLLDSAELYDPQSDTWEPAGRLRLARFFDEPSWAMLQNGSVFIVGGGTCCPYQAVNTAELFDPETLESTLLPAKKTAANGKAVVLEDGRILIAGGRTGIQPTINTVPDVEIYDPASQAWISTGFMSSRRDDHGATLLTNGKVLASGGDVGSFGGSIAARSTELYDPVAATWSPSAPMNVARWLHMAVLLKSGKVLVAGGYGASGNILSSAEIYTPDQGPNCATSATYAGGGISVHAHVETKATSLLNIWKIHPPNTTELLMKLVTGTQDVTTVFPVLPNIGNIGVLTTLSTLSEGITCESFTMADTSGRR
jgi:hypothetical protein